MANRAKYTAQSFGIGREYMEFQLKLNGASAPTVLEGNEVVASATHTGGTNVITVTLKDSFPKVVAHAVDVRDDAGNGSYATIGSITGEASATVPTAPISFKIQTFVAGGTASNDSTLVVVITLALRNSNVTAGN
jgi:hypothetical protein